MCHLLVVAFHILFISVLIIYIYMLVLFINNIDHRKKKLKVKSNPEFHLSFHNLQLSFYFHILVEYRAGS